MSLKPCGIISVGSGRPLQRRVRGEVRSTSPIAAVGEGEGLAAAMLLDEVEADARDLLAVHGGDAADLGPDGASDILG
jgi:hypothetical protein